MKAETNAPDVPVTSTAAPGTTARRRAWPWLLVGAGLLVAAGWMAGIGKHPTGTAEPTASARPPAVPVTAVAARTGDVPEFLNGLGTVTAFNTVVVKSRVDGQLNSVLFREGQLVQSGDLLAEIDPRPFQVQLAQAEGQLAKDNAQMKAAQILLVRTRELSQRDLIPAQQLDDQVATVGQAEGAIESDKAMIENAKLQLTYSRITAPISGRVGLRLVDAGNVVHANDANGLVVITQVQPIAVVFTIPADSLSAVLKKQNGKAPLVAEAYDRGGETRLAVGSLSAVDNQIDASTGTARLKAVFPNDDNALFPNQFVNLRLLLDTLEGVVVVPGAAIQRGPQGTFVYVVNRDQTVDVRPVTPGPGSGGLVAIKSGLEAGETVVIDGIDKLRPGSTVQVREPQPPSREPKPGK